jgi:hypothetical protein
MSDHFDPYHVWLGIPPEERPDGKPNYYRLLGLRLYEDNSDVISNALDQRRGHLRSVQGGKRAALSQQLLNEVSTAGVCLLDAVKRQRYDDQLRTKLATDEPAPIPLSALPSPAPNLQIPAGLPPEPHFPNPYPVAGPPAIPIRNPPVPVAPAAVGGRPSWFTPIVFGSSGVLVLLLLIVGVGLFLAFRSRSRPEVAVIKHWPQIEQNKAVKNRTSSNTAGSVADSANTKSVDASVSDSAGVPNAPPQPGPRQPRSMSKTSSEPRVAFMFAGNESIHIPLPAEMTTSQAEFTIELWVKRDLNENAHYLFSAGQPGNLQLQTLPLAGLGSASSIALTASKLRTSRNTALAPDQWMHVALTHSGSTFQVFVGGKSELRMNLRPGFALVSPLVLGNLLSGPSDRGFQGLIRDVRVSRGRRYTGEFVPEEQLAADEKTLVLLDLDARRQTSQAIDNLVRGTPPIEVTGARRVALTPEGEVAGLLSDGAVDLLRTLSVASDVLEGGAGQTPAGIETRAAAGRTRIFIPYRPSAEYDVELELTRQEGAGGAFVGLEIAGRQVVLAIDAFPTAGAGLVLLPGDLGQVATDAIKALSSPLLVTGQRQDYIIKVRLPPTGFSISLEQQGRALTTLHGSLNALNCPPEFGLPIGHGMSLGSIDAKVQIHRALLRPVTKEFPPHILASLSRTMPTVKTAKAPQPASKSITAAAPPPQPKAQVRHPMPPPDKIAAAIEQAKSIYADQSKQATKPAQKAALAREIYAAGEKTNSDPIARFVLIDLARKLFVQAGDVQSALAASRLLEKEYEIPPQEVIVATVDALEDAPLSADQRTTLVKSASELADAALEAELFEAADKLSAIAAKSAPRQRDADLKKDVAQRRSHIARIAKEWTTARPSVEKLKTDPMDAAANLIAGKFYCFYAEDFGRGLKHLADSGDAALAPPAKLDLAAGGDASARFTAAEAWQKAGSSVTERDEKLALQRREKWLLEHCVVSLSGLEKLRAEKRLDELKDIKPGRTTVAGVVESPAPAAPTRPFALIGRVAGVGGDARVTVEYEHGYRVDSEDLARLVNTARLAPGAIHLVLEGVLTVPSDQTVIVRHYGGSSTGAQQLFIEGALFSTVGGNASTTETKSQQLAKGSYLVHWELAGGDLGTPRLEFVTTMPQPDGSGPRLPLAPNKAIIDSARRQARTSIHFGPAQ